jgi:ubiquitin-like domain-containing CTD phosphatase 1
MANEDCTTSNEQHASSSTINLLEFIAKHKDKEYKCILSSEASLIDLKQRLFELTKVSIEKQKIITKSNKMKKILTSKSVIKFVDLELKPIDLKFTLMGTPDSQIFVDPSQMDELPEVIDDLDFDYFPESGVKSVGSDPHNLQKLKEKMDNVQIHVINPPRPGKKLCVLDIDYTIFDCKDARTSSHNIDVHIRPHVHEFLTAIYKDYDICFWSQTHWRWLEMKLTECNILTNSAYSISFVLDKTSMFKVTSEVTGKKRVHYVKPLQFIFSKFPQSYNFRNTVHVDDLSRNFAMNPSNGIKVSAFKDCSTARQHDRELLDLKDYLELAASKSDDVRQCNLRNWKKELKELRNKQPNK